MPFALKDIIDVEGVATSCHSALREGHIAADDARVARRLKAAGGILLGKLSTHEFALGGPSFDLPFPPARNPWNPALFPGGSSSGAGAALAAGFVAAAIGTDTGGSVRNPASCCGLVGIKATYGRVSRQGVFPLSYSLDNVGPLTRTVADNALLLDVISGHDPADPGSTRGPASDCRGALGREIAGLRIGVIRHFYRRDLEASGEVGDGIEAALKVLEDLGCEIVEIETEPLQDFAACNRIILLSEACAIHRRWLQERPEAYGQLTRQRLLPGLFLSAGDYVEANRWRRCLSENLDRQLQAVDVAVTASSMEQPFLDRRPGRDRDLLSAPGTHPLQPLKPPGAGLADRLRWRRHAAFDADRRPAFRRSDDLPCRRCLRAGRPDGIRAIRRSPSRRRRLPPPPGRA